MNHLNQSTPTLDRLYRALCVPDQPESPPEPTPAEYARNVRNSCREEAVEALGLAIDRLDEIDHDGNERGTQKYLENLQEYLRNDLEG